MDEKFIRSAGETVSSTSKELREVAPQFGGKPGEPVPEVDPEDLKAVWKLRRDAEAPHPGQQVAIGLELAKHVCKPDADIQAVSYRSFFLWLVTQIVPQQFAMFTRGGEPIEAAFRAAAKVPAEWMGVGIVRDRPPFDVETFVRLCGTAH